MRVIKTLTDASEIMQILCRGTADSLFIMYDHVIPILPGVAPYHVYRSDDSRDDLNKLKEELTDLFKDIDTWQICRFENLFIYAGFDESEIDTLKQVCFEFKERYHVTIDVQVYDQNLKKSFLIEEIK